MKIPWLYYIMQNRALYQGSFVTPSERRTKVNGENTVDINDSKHNDDVNSAVCDAEKDGVSLRKFRRHGM